MVIPPDDFQLLTWYEFECIVDGFARREDKKWLHTRMIATMIANQFAKRKMKPTELFRLDIDDEVPLVSLKDFKKMQKAWSKN